MKAIDEANELCREIISPDIRASGAQIYVASHPENLPRVPRCLGYCILNQRALRMALQRNGAWRGRGPIVVVDVAAVIENASDDPNSWLSVDRLILSVALHEVSHVVPLRLPPDEDAGLSPLERAIWSYREAEETVLFANRIDAAKSPDKHPCVFGHGPSFIRNCVHLYFRAHRLGYRFSPWNRLFAGPQYGLSAFHQYADALGAEPARMIDATFTEISGVPAPREFRGLFMRDVNSWLRWKRSTPAGFMEELPDESSRRCT